MNLIQLDAVIDKYKLDPKEVAAQLFPGNKYPKLALNRVVKGEASLYEEQVSKLAALAGVPIADLYAGAWSAGKSKDYNTVVFTNDRYKAELNTDTWLTRLFDKGSLFHESIITSGSMKLSDYFRELNAIINKYHKENER